MSSENRPKWSGAAPEPRKQSTLKPPGETPELAAWPGGAAENIGFRWPQYLQLGRQDGAAARTVLARLEISKLPPSTNRLFFNEPGKGRTKTSRYRKWRTDAGWELKLQKVRPISGPVSIHVNLPDLPGRLPDLDNTAKAIVDVLVKQRVIEEDDRRIVRSLSLNWSRNLKAVLIVIKRADA